MSLRLQSYIYNKYEVLSLDTYSHVYHHVKIVLLTMDLSRQKIDILLGESNKQKQHWHIINVAIIRSHVPEVNINLSVSCFWAPPICEGSVRPKAEVQLLHVTGN